MLSLSLNVITLNRGRLEAPDFVRPQQAKNVIFVKDKMGLSFGVQTKFPILFIRFELELS